MDELNIRALPHSVEAEQAVLGSMLLDERCVADVIERLRPDDFYMRQNREIYEVMYGMFTRFETIDPVTVLDRMKQAGVYDENTSVAYVKQLWEITPTAANVLEHADIVRDKAVLRRVGETAGELLEMARSEAGTATQVLEAAEQRIYAIRQGRSASGMEHISGVMNAAWEAIKARQAQGSEFPGLSTGFIDLDRCISGLNDSDLLILAARPGVGKTSLVLNMGLDVGKKSGRNVAIFSLEMSREQLGMRLISMESAIHNKHLITGRLQGEEEWSRAAMAVAALSQANIYIDDDASVTVADINAKCRRIKNLGLVIVDYLQLMTSAGGPGRGGENRQQVVADMSRSLKIMAKELKVPVICLSQLSRANVNRAAGQRAPMLSDLRDSGQIEQDADIVIFLHADEEEDGPNVVKCIVAKNRHGETRDIKLAWQPELYTFTNLAYGYDEDDY